MPRNAFSGPDALDEWDEPIRIDEQRRIEAAVVYADIPCWLAPLNERKPELHGLPAVHFLRAAWHEEIRRWKNSVYVRTINAHDGALAAALRPYCSMESKKPVPAEAQGLNFINEFEPNNLQPRFPVQIQVKPSRRHEP